MSTMKKTFFSRLLWARKKRDEEVGLESTRPLMPEAEAPIDCPAVSVEWRVGDVILNTYEVKQVHEGGGMGLVYRVHHRNWNMDLAVKSPRPDFFRQPSHKENFVRECLSWIGLGLHPHIVCCYYVRLLGGIPRVFAEYVHGGSLEEWIRSKRLYEGGPDMALERILDIAIQIAWALHFAHEQGLVHQDVKPANIMMTPDGTAKLTDFGLARARVATAEIVARGIQESVLVSSGGMTPAYCSPEQAEGVALHQTGADESSAPKLTRKTDIWSWAVSVLEMFTGGVTWSQGRVADMVLREYLTGERVEADCPRMPSSVAELLISCLRRALQDRPADMRFVTSALLASYREVVGRDYARKEPLKAEGMPDALSNQGVSLIDLGLPEEAISKFEAALRVEASHPVATFNQGLLLWRMGRMTDETLLTRLRETEGHAGSTGHPCLLQAKVHLEGGDTESATEQLEKIGLESRDPEWNRAMAQAKSGFGSRYTRPRLLGRHAASVDAVAMSRDGRWGLSGCADNTLHLWDLATGECLRSLVGHVRAVNSVAISQDGRWGLSGSRDKTLRLWDLATGECLRSFVGHISGVISVAISQDGQMGLSGSGALGSCDDCTVRLWDLATGECLRTFAGHTDSVVSVAFAPEGQWGISGSRDRTLRLWDFATGQCREMEAYARGTDLSVERDGHTQGPRVAVGPDGHWALSGSQDKTLRLWDTGNGRCLQTFEGHAAPLLTISISADGRWVLSGSADRTLRLWDIWTGRCLRTCHGHDASVEAVAISADGRWALSGSRDKTLRLWEFSKGFVQHFVENRPCNAEEHQEAKDEVASSIDRAESLLAANDIGSALESLRAAQKIDGYGQSPSVIQLKSRIALYARRKGLHASWCSRALEGHTAPVVSLAITQDSRWAVSGSEDKTLRVWELESGRCLRILDGHAHAVTSVVISPDGRLAEAKSGGDSLLWDLSTGKCLRKYAGQTTGIVSADITPDWRWGLSPGLPPDLVSPKIGLMISRPGHVRRGTLQLWERATGRCLRTLEGHTDRVYSLATTPDGRCGLSGSGDKTLRLWDLASGHCIRTLQGHTDGVVSVKVSADGRWGLSGSTDKTLRLWELSTGQCLRVLGGHTLPVFSIAISADGRWGLSGSMDKTLRLWELNSGRCFRTIEGHKSTVASVAVSADGRWVLSGCGHHMDQGVGDNAIRLWELDWDYEFPGWADWDEGARPHLVNFLTLHTPYAASLPESGTPREEQITLALTRRGRPTWSDDDFQSLVRTLQHAGYGWLRPEDVKRELEKMAADWDGPPPLPWETQI